MDSSKLFGEAEECHSSESGWTMYIGSPIHGDDDNGGNSDDGGSDGGAGGFEYNTYANHHDDDDNSDDSMASDASSGPSYPYGNGEVRHRSAHFNHEKQEHYGKRGSDKKAKRHMEKQKYSQGRRNQEKEEVIFAAARARTPAQSASKVKTNDWIGQRK